MDDEVSRDLLASDNTEHGDYLGIRSGWLTYLPKGKPNDHPYASKNRVRGKPARVARKFVSQEHNDAAFEKFHNLLEAKAFSIKNIGILKGKDIERAYNSLYDKRKQSRMIQSCMVGANSNKFKLYTDNPSVVRLLVLWDRFKGENVIVARALLWKTPKGIYVDRIYGSDTAVTFLRNYVDKKGWMRYIDWDVYGKPSDYNPRAERRREKVTLEVKVPYQDWYDYNTPYLDTFVLRRDNITEDYYVEGDFLPS